MKLNKLHFFLVMLSVSFGILAEIQENESPSLFSDRSILLGVHRGGRDQWPENTLMAFKSVTRRWPDALLELDIHVTADGQVVVIHDDTVDRTTNTAGVIRNMTLAEIRALDAAYRFSPDAGKSFPYRGKGITIPTLHEVLQVSPSHRFLIEMKDGEGIVAATIAAIREAGAANRCILASISPQFMEDTRRIAPEIFTCYDFMSAALLLSELRYGNWNTHIPEHKMIALSPALQKRFNLTQKEIQSLRKKGILVTFWTINQETEMRRILKIGVDSILTDRPNVLAKILAEHRKK
ncbi:MAG: glycerophosphodiester phosphodiesterase [Candidatus Hydrogenedentes bacterium]|nr:glycerophosphodiester phosphodiesterase [Candidatus Hydrogenedentota bacterium]